MVDAFTSEPFSGNPAGICIVRGPSISEDLMSKIAAEMKHAETAFLVPRSTNGHFDLRWFTPTVEVDLCGHATLASAHLLCEIGEVAANQAIVFHTRSGALGARAKGSLIELDFPAVPVGARRLPGQVSGLEDALFTGSNTMDYLVELDSEESIHSLAPDLTEVAALGNRGLIVTAKAGGKYDFISRFFAPNAGVPEDPVTGSAHCALAPYWAPKLGKHRMLAYQASARGGEVGVEISNDRVKLTGSAVTVLAGRFCL